MVGEKTIEQNAEAFGFVSFQITNRLSSTTNMPIGLLY